MEADRIAAVHLPPLPTSFDEEQKGALDAPPPVELPALPAIPPSPAARDEPPELPTSNDAAIDDQNDDAPPEPVMETPPRAEPSAAPSVVDLSSSHEEPTTQVDSTKDEASVPEATGDMDEDMPYIEDILAKFEQGEEAAQAKEPGEEAEEEDDLASAFSSPLSSLPDLPTDMPNSPEPPAPSALPDIPHAESSSAAQARMAKTTTKKRKSPVVKPKKVVSVESDAQAPADEALVEVKEEVDPAKKPAAKRARPAERPARAAKKQRVRSDSGTPVSTKDRPPDKIAPRVKAMTDARIKEVLKGKTEEYQMAPCLRPRYKQWGKCTQCIQKNGGDSCRFKDVRVFPIDPVTTDIVGEGEFRSTSWAEPMVPLPTNFNQPFEEPQILWTERTVAPTLAPLITREMRHASRPGIILRGVDTAKHRSVCDFCSTTIFGGFWFCKKCGREFCLVCERHFSDSVDTIHTSPWPVPDAARPRLLKCSTAAVAHNNPPLEEGQPKPLAFHFRSDLQPVSRLSAEEWRQHWLGLADFVLEGDQSEEEKLALLGLTEDADELLRSTKEWNSTTKYLVKKSEDDKGLSPEETEKVYTKLTHPTAPLPVDPAGLQEHSRKFMRIDVKDLDNDKFDTLWSRGEPLVVTGVGDRFKLSWTPDDFIERFGSEMCNVYDCQTEISHPYTLAWFFETFKDPSNRSKAILKLKDWPQTSDFESTHTGLYNDFCDALPVPDFTRRDGRMNMYAHFPPGPTRPDIGPKMYNAFAAKEGPRGHGSTRLHMDVADAVNVMLYASPLATSNGSKKKTTTGGEEKASEGQNSVLGQTDGTSIPAEAAPNGAPSVEDDSPPQPGCAVWDIFRAEDAPILREYLRKKFDSTHKFTDPIHSQLFYLDSNMRKQLWERYGVVSWRIYQYPGQAVFIPAGCAHQVCNLADCIKIAIDFVSPHNVSRCQALTQDFQNENMVKAWKEDVLQLYHVLWFSWLSCRETRARRTEEAKRLEEAQAARAMHLASLENGDHEVIPSGHRVNGDINGRPSPTKLLGHEVSSVRDETGPNASIPAASIATLAEQDAKARDAASMPPPPPPPPAGTLSAVEPTVSSSTNPRETVKRLLVNRLCEATIHAVEPPPTRTHTMPSAASRWVNKLKDKSAPDSASPPNAKKAKSKKLTTGDFVRMGLLNADVAMGVLRSQMGAGLTGQTGDGDDEDVEMEDVGVVSAGLAQVPNSADGGDAGAIPDLPTMHSVEATDSSPTMPTMNGETEGQRTVGPNAHLVESTDQATGKAASILPEPEADLGPDEAMMQFVNAFEEDAMEVNKPEEDNFEGDD